MQNRELSWLNFNKRVLEEASNIDLPLLERLKFLEIYQSNLDEFFMVRVAANQRLYNHMPDMVDDKTEIKISKILDMILENVCELNYKKDQIYKDLLSDMSKENINVFNYKNIPEDFAKYVKKVFKDEYLGFLSPQIIDYSHPFPFLESKGEYLFVRLDIKNTFGILNVSNIGLNYIKQDNNIIFIDDIIHLCTNQIFKKYKIISKAVIKVSRNADIVLEDLMDEEVVDYRTTMKTLVKKRGKLKPIRLEFYDEAPKEILDMLLDKLGIDKKYIFISHTPLNLKFIYGLIAQLPSKYLYPRLIHKSPTFIEPAKSIMAQVSKRDILLSYPYESIDPFLDLIKEAAWDKSVVSINITIYRLASHSKLIDYLLQALDNKKEVTAVIELRARFDEDNNINYSEVLEEAGCRIIYGFQNYKIHSKLCLITRKIGDKMNYITQVGTGNYNEKTANLYTDYSYITANTQIGNDARTFFNNIMLGRLEDDYNKLLVSPFGLKKKVISMIDSEIKKGENGYIFMKLNSLTDEDIINKFHEASKAGVKIDLIIRGICCILPGIKGETDNISVRSIVGRFLEHSRVYLFGKYDAKLYISSADMMSRNTMRRVEVACPIVSNEVRTEILRQIGVLLDDNYNAHILNSFGDYEKVEGNKINAFELLFHNNKKEAVIDETNELKNLIRINLKKVCEPRCSVTIDDVKYGFDYKLKDNYIKIVSENSKKMSRAFIERMFYLTYKLKEMNKKLVIICSYEITNECRDLFVHNNIEIYDTKNYEEFLSNSLN